MKPFRSCSWYSIRARRPSAAIACFAIGSLNVVYSLPSSARRTKRVFPDCVLNALTSSTLTSRWAMPWSYP